MSIQYGMGTIEHPVERCDNALWVSGPIVDKTLTAPIELKLGNMVGLLTLDISLLWSVWAKELEEGKNQIECAIGRLLARGWYLAGP